MYAIRSYYERIIDEQVDEDTQREKVVIHQRPCQIYQEKDTDCGKEGNILPFDL